MKPKTNEMQNFMCIYVYECAIVNSVGGTPCIILGRGPNQWATPNLIEHRIKLTSGDMPLTGAVIECSPVVEWADFKNLWEQFPASVHVSHTEGCLC